MGAQLFGGHYFSLKGAHRALRHWVELVLNSLIYGVPFCSNDFKGEVDISVKGEDNPLDGWVSLFYFKEGAYEKIM